LQREDRTINVLVEEIARLDAAYRTFAPVVFADEPAAASIDRDEPSIVKADLRTLSPVAHSYR
jgi:hypothetical protein